MGKSRQDRACEALRSHLLNGSCGKVTPYLMEYMREREYIQENGAPTALGIRLGISALTHVGELESYRNPARSSDEAGLDLASD